LLFLILTARIVNKVNQARGNGNHMYAGKANCGPVNNNREEKFHPSKKEMTCMPKTNVVAMKNHDVIVIIFLTVNFWLLSIDLFIRKIIANNNTRE
jgi:hypothetical protein